MHRTNRIIPDPRSQSGSRVRLSAFPWAFVFALQGCLFSTGAERSSPFNPPYRGYYAFAFPDAGAVLELDSAYMVRWKASDSAGGDSVRLSIYKAGALLADLAPGRAVDGGFAWSLPATRSSGDWRLGSGSDYRLRLVNLADTSKNDFGPRFRIHSRYSGNLALIQPVAKTRFAANSIVDVVWASHGKTGEMLGAQLYRGGTLLKNLDSIWVGGDPYIRKSWAWTAAIAPSAAGEDFRLRIFSRSDPSIECIGQDFGVYRDGGFEFRFPGNGDTLLAGSPTQADWIVSGQPSHDYTMSLWNDSALILAYPFVYASVAMHTWNWKVPASLAGGRYRLRISSYPDTGITAFSGAFFVNPLEPDGFEEDGAPASAKPIPVDGKPQARTLTPGDTDWIRIDPEPGKAYIAESQSRFALDLALFDSAGAPYGVNAGKRVRIDLANADTGPYYLRARARISQDPDFGPYEVSVRAYDSAGSFPVAFTAPSRGEAWTAGTTHPVIWARESANYGTSVELSVWSGTSPQFRLGCVFNAGYYDWRIPTDASPGEKRIRINPCRVSAPDSIGVFAYSPAFILRRGPTDSFEPDDSPEGAKPIIPDGEAQSRRLTPGDTDWVRFDAVAGFTYRASADFFFSTCFLQFVDGAGTILASTAGSGASVAFSPPEEGIYYLRIGGYPDNGGADYTLSLASSAAPGDSVQGP